MVDIDFTAVAKCAEGKARLAVQSFLVLGKDRFKQAEISQDVEVNIPKFKVSATADKSYMNADDDATFHLTYENREQAIVKNVKLSFTSSNPDFLSDSVAIMNAGKLKISGSTLSLSEMISGGKGAVDLKVRFDRRKIGTEAEAGLRIEVSYDLGGEPVSYPVGSAKIKISSTLNISSAGYYYSRQGDQLGVGPLPPTVDIPTRYWIFWEADNFGNDLKDFSLTAELPDNIVWTDNKSLLAGNLRYGQIGKRVIWSVDDISKDGGNNKAAFEIEIIPTANDIGKIKGLLSDIKYSAYDKFTGQAMSGDLKTITTDLEFDKMASGKGKIVE
jgi:hypothetical protein